MSKSYLKQTGKVICESTNRIPPTRYITQEGNFFVAISNEVMGSKLSICLFAGFKFNRWFQDRF